MEHSFIGQELIEFDDYPEHTIIRQTYDLCDSGKIYCTIRLDAHKIYLCVHTRFYPPLKPRHIKRFLSDMYKVGMPFATTLGFTDIALIGKNVKLIKMLTRNKAKRLPSKELHAFMPGVDVWLYTLEKEFIHA